MTRTTTLLATLPGLLLLGACATTPPAGIGGCQSQAPAGACPKAQGVNINLKKAGGSMATPECVTAEPGSTVRLNIQQVQTNNGSVITVPADAVDGWLVSSNTDPAEKSKILIQVPADVTEGERKYLVLANDGACLDPRFVIER